MRLAKGWRLWAAAALVGASLSASQSAEKPAPFDVAGVETMAGSRVIADHIARRKISFVPSSILLERHPALRPLAAVLSKNTAHLRLRIVGPNRLSGTAVETVTATVKNYLDLERNRAVTATPNCPGACQIEVVGEGAAAVTSTLTISFVPGGASGLQGPDKIDVSLNSAPDSGVSPGQISMWVAHSDNQPAVVKTLEDAALRTAAKFVSDQVNDRPLACGFPNRPATNSGGKLLFDFGFELSSGNILTSRVAPYTAVRGFGTQRADALPRHTDFASEDLSSPLAVTVRSKCTSGSDAMESVVAIALDGVDDTATVTDTAPNVSNGFWIDAVIRWFGENGAAEYPPINSIVARSLGGPKSSWGLQLNGGHPEVGVVLDGSGGLVQLRALSTDALQPDRWYRLRAGWTPGEGASLYVDGKRQKVTCLSTATVVGECGSAGSLHEPTVALGVLLGAHHGSQNEAFHRVRYTFNGLLGQVALTAR